MFELGSYECELLLNFEKSGSLQGLSELMGKDISVVSRNLKAISERSQVIEKVRGRWQLTDEGRSLNRWTEEAIFSQRLVLSRQKYLKIATTREFASRVLIPQTRTLIGDEEITVSIVSSDEGIEKLLLSGEADFGFDCGRPNDPLISFKRVAKESFVCVASPAFLKRFGIKNMKDVQERDHLKFTRSSQSIFDLDVEAKHYYGTFSDISTLREACKLGYGWAILPYYTVAKEIKSKELKMVKDFQHPDEKFGVWWVRERKSIKPWAEKAMAWLEKQETILKHN